MNALYRPVFEECQVLTVTNAILYRDSFLKSATRVVLIELTTVFITPVNEPGWSQSLHLLLLTVICGHRLFATLAIVISQ